ncbi:MAG: hypothetical protein JJU05_07795 [Verrucomicrobia bacterium]|nr:hypothetical protein [Verrucomicrobiota bacterium]MCH8527476.1 hypothetical protein [Kiritimatiellia bacterium]
MRIPTKNQLRLAVLFPVFFATTQAGVITWGIATNASNINDLDIITGGSVLYAMNGTAVEDPPGTLTVNGITFNSTDFVTLPAGVTFSPASGTARDSGVNNLPLSPSTGSTTYDNLLRSFTDPRVSTSSGGDGKSGTMTFGNLTQGQAYQIQIWYNDQRSFGVDRVMTYGDGLGNNVNLAADSGNYGQFAIGTFTASGTSQNLFMATSGFANVHYNAIMV